MKIKTACHRGALDDCLETEKDLDIKVFDCLTKGGIYKFYCYDSRINADRYLIYDIVHNLGMPQWIHVYKD